MKLPLSLLEAIEGYGIKGEDIIFAANGDLDECFRFADSVIAITKDKFIREQPGSGQKKQLPIIDNCNYDLQTGFRQLN